MERKNVIRCILAILMMIYIGWAMVFCHHKAAARTCKGVKVEVFDPSHNNFVTSEAVFHNLATLGIDPSGMFRSQIDLRNLENTLAGCDNIETVNCVLLTDDSLLVEVQPIVPLLRVFDRNDQDYYINRAGKRMEASCLYRIDVPVVAGIMPVTHASQIRRICSISGNALPQRFLRIVDRYADKPAALKQAGIAYATEQVIDLFANGVNAVHVYSMNHPDLARAIRDNVREIIA